MGAVQWLVGRELRARWRSVAGLALLVAITGGLVLAAAAGSRRTASAYDRFVDRTATRDLSVQIDADDPDPYLERIEQLPSVVASGRVEIYPVAPTDESVDTEVDIALFVSPDGAYGADVDRPRVLEGRLPDPEAVDEIIVNELAARLAGLAVGDRIEVVAFTPDQLRTLHAGGEFTGFGGPVLDLEVVGLGRQAADLQGADVTAGGVLLGTPALQRSLDGEAGVLGGLLSLRLTPGAAAAEVREQVSGIAGDIQFDLTGADADFADASRDASGVLARALAAFAAVAAFAAATAVGGAITRQVGRSRDTDTTFAALGLDRRSRTLVSGAVPGLGLVMGAVLAPIVAVTASARFPISVARAMEPEPGVRLDLAVLVTGAVSIAVLGCGWVLVATRRADRVRSAPAGALFARLPAWLPPGPAIGVAHAFERRSSGRTVPMRAAAAAAALGVVGIVGSATVVHSLDAVYGDPARYGWTWSVEPDVYTEDREGLLDEIVDTDGIEAVAIRHTARVELDGIVIEGAAFDARTGTIEPSLREGRVPTGRREVLLGQRTADDLAVSVGDRVRARTADGPDAVDVQVVGIGVLAPVDSTDPGSGAVLTTEGMRDLRRSDGFTGVLLRYEPGFDPAAFEGSLMEREVADFSAVYSRPHPPGGLTNLRRAMPVVGALGAFFVALAVAEVTHALVVSTRRRRRELATLQALGMRRRQARAVVACTAAAIASAGIVAGMPLGLALGRVVWRLVISGQGVLDDPTVPALVLVAVVPVALVVAVLVSLGPSATATRRASIALRSE